MGVGAAAGIVPLLAAAVHAPQADAKTFTVTSKKASGKGSLRRAVARANRHRGRDRVVFRSRLSGTVPLRRDITVTDGLVIEGRRGRLPIEAGRAGSALRFQPKHDSGGPPENPLVLRNLSLRRVHVRNAADYEDLKVDHSLISGDGVRGTGIDVTGSLGDAGLFVTRSKVTGFDGIGIDVGSTYDSMRIQHSKVSHNRLGVHLFKAVGTIKSSTISGNAPSGGVTASYYSFVTVTKSTISGNVAASNEERPGSGGGIDAYYEAGALVQNSTISGNSATGGQSLGGGLYGTVDVVSSTVTGNTAAQGGGLFSAPDAYGTDGISITDSLVARNDANQGADCGGMPTSKGGNVFGSGGCARAPKPTDLVTSRRLFGRLADNGGPTRTHALPKGSPAIGHATGAADLKTDQRGQRRDRHPDSGAFER